MLSQVTPPLVHYGNSHISQLKHSFISFQIISLNIQQKVMVFKTHMSYVFFFFI